MRVAIVENTAVTHHGQVGVALHEAGARIELWKPWRDGLLPAPESFDALVVFGGEQTALADDLHPYLPRLARLMEETAATGKAVLGICLGAQVMARGIGAENRIGTAPEFGWQEVALTEAGAQDPLLSQLPQHFRSFQWHSDTFTLPPGAVALATSPVAPVQCYRFGARGYGMQFHFEASRAVVADWVATFPAIIDRLAPGWRATYPETAKGPGAQSDEIGLTLARGWVALI